MAQPGLSDVLVGLPPIAGPGPRVLVLGSMPGAKSLELQQYYAFVGNSFWPIMERLFGDAECLSYAARKRMLREHRVAVWDVLKCCQRVGSLDSTIRGEVANDLCGWLRARRDVHAVFFNGTKAEQAFQRLVLSELAGLQRRFRYQRLPSTSPANAQLTFKQKLAAWRAVKRAAMR